MSAVALDLGANVKPARMPIVAFLVGILVAGFAWVLATPPGSAPDEQAHMIKAIALAHGQLTGTSGPLPGYATYAPLTQRQRDLLRTDTRYFRVNPGLIPAPPCYASEAMARPCRPEPNATPRSQASYVGNFPPLGYLPMAVGARFGNSATTATLLARAANWLVCWALLALGVVAVAGRHARRVESLLALMIGLTPSVWFVFGSANPSGLEISAAVGLASGLVAVSGDQLPRRWVPVFTCTAAGVLACVRPTSWLWLVAIGGVAAVLGRHAIRRTVRRLAPWSFVTLAGVALTVWWQTAVPAPALRLPPISPHSFANAATALGKVHFPAQYAGAFQWLSVYSPSPLVWLGLVTSVAFLVAACLRAPRRLGRALALLTGGLVPLVITYSAVIHESTGWSAAARYIFPVTCALFVLGGEATVRERPLPRSAVLSFLLSSLTVQLAGFLVAAGAPASDAYHHPLLGLPLLAAAAALGMCMQATSISALAMTRSATAVRRRSEQKTGGNTSSLVPADATAGGRA